MLVARAAVQRPRVVLIDADSQGALDVVSRMRELPQGEDIHVLFVAAPGGAMTSREEALAHEGTGFFVRPVDLPALVKEVEALTGGMHDAEGGQPEGTPPPAIAAPAQKLSSAPPSPRRAPSSGPPSEGPVSAALPPTSIAWAAASRAVGLGPPVSPDLQRLLAEAEQRAHVAGDDSSSPSPEQEVEAVLPSELLAALDEPLDDDDRDPETAMPTRPPSLATRERTNDGGAPRTTGATGTGSGATPHGSSVTGPGTGEESLTPGPRAPAEASPRPPRVGTPEPERADVRRSPPTLAAAERQPQENPGFRPRPGEAGDAPSRSRSRPGEAADAPSKSRPHPGEAGDVPSPASGPPMPVLAQAIAGRNTTSLCFASPDAERRVVLREGDVVTCASTAEDESLLAFLGVRGELPRETVRRLASRFPAFGKHAAAALVARGYLRQDQMWSTLRAHAEWVLSRVLQTSEARAVVEAQPPGRLASEPSVFGGATGAEVFVEVVRRVVSPTDALERLGGDSAHLGQGGAYHLLVECALAPLELDLLRAAPGRTVREVLDSTTDADFAAVVFAVTELGVLDVLPALSSPRGDGDAAADVAALDSDAIRERVRARLQLVEDGDYFAILGVGREATGYEVKRAFLELRRTFDPSRLLSPELADLAGDVRTVTSVLEEAYDILKDPARRERYRRAIEGSPKG
jgi:hypothetical protein